jgi:GNAT superfamily N-acetyltransferase
MQLKHPRMKIGRRIVRANHGTPEAVYTAIRDLMRMESHRLGFVPMAAIRDAVKCRRLWYAEEHGHCIGYLLASENAVYCTIVQLVVHVDFRRKGIGTKLFDACRLHTQKDIHAKVRGDLPATLFWESTASYIDRREIHEKSQKLANVFVHIRGCKPTAKDGKLNP